MRRANAVESGGKGKDTRHRAQRASGNRGIMEAGSHDELMAKHGAYYELYTAQAREQGVSC